MPGAIEKGGAARRPRRRTFVLENLIVSVNVVFPLFALMAVGFLLNRIGLLDGRTAEKMNTVTFKAFLPVLIFYNIYRTDVGEIFDARLVLLALALVALLFLVLWLIVPRVEKDYRRRGVLIQGMFRSNFILYGLPVTASLFGEENTGTAAMLVAFVVPLYNVLSVVILEWYASRQIHIKKIAKGIATNPLILGAICGGLFLLFGVRMPQALEDAVQDLSGLATPMAFLVLGASFRFSSLAGNWKALVCAVAVKLVAVPAVLLPVCVAFGYRSLALAALLTMLGAPTAVSSYTMARQLDADSELAGQIVVFTSVCSILTMFFWVFLLRQLALL